MLNCWNNCIWNCGSYTYIRLPIHVPCTGACMRLSAALCTFCIQFVKSFCYCITAACYNHFNIDCCCCCMVQQIRRNLWTLWRVYAVARTGRASAAARHITISVRPEFIIRGRFYAATVSLLNAKRPIQTGAASRFSNFKSHARAVIDWICRCRSICGFDAVGLFSGCLPFRRKNVVECSADQKSGITIFEMRCEMVRSFGCAEFYGGVTWYCTIGCIFVWTVL